MTETRVRAAPHSVVSGSPAQCCVSLVHELGTQMCGIEHTRQIVLEQDNDKCLYRRATSKTTASFDLVERELLARKRIAYAQLVNRISETIPIYSLLKFYGAAGDGFLRRGMPGKRDCPISILDHIECTDAHNQTIGHAHLHKSMFLHWSRCPQLRESPLLASRQPLVTAAS